MKAIIKLGLVSLIVSVGIALADPAFAGVRVAPNVTVNLQTKTASGALGTARRVSGNQSIFCNVNSSDNSVHCEATAPNGDHADCTLSGALTDDRPPRTLGTLNPDSFITFKWMTLQGVTGNVCGFLQVINSSEYEPKPL